jgi:hypothetical protein
MLLHASRLLAMQTADADDGRLAWEAAADVCKCLVPPRKKTGHPELGGGEQA